MSRRQLDRCCWCMDIRPLALLTLTLTPVLNLTPPRTESFGLSSATKNREHGRATFPFTFFIHTSIVTQCMDNKQRAGRISDRYPLNLEHFNIV